jgi:hypothetical protein
VQVDWSKVSQGSFALEQPSEAAIERRRNLAGEQ